MLFNIDGDPVDEMDEKYDTVLTTIGGGMTDTVTLDLKPSIQLKAFGDKIYWYDSSKTVKHMLDDLEETLSIFGKQGYKFTDPDQLEVVHKNYIGNMAG